MLLQSLATCRVDPPEPQIPIRMLAPPSPEPAGPFIASTGPGLQVRANTVPTRPTTWLPLHHGSSVDADDL
jgi:hypothetical protein